MFILWVLEEDACSTRLVFVEKDHQRELSSAEDDQHDG